MKHSFSRSRGWYWSNFCQWAKSIGCKVIGTVGSDSKIDIAKKRMRFYLLTTTKEADKKVLEITENKVGAVYDGVGKDTFEKSINCFKT